MTDKILDVKNLSVSFETFFGEVEAVRDITFHLNRKETLAIVGESGSGKSVTASSIMQLLPKPAAVYKNGEIYFEGINILEKTDKEMEDVRGNEISMIFQDPMTYLNPTMKVGPQIVEGALKHKKISKKDARDRAIELLDLVAVPQPDKRVDQYPHQFSGGMRQRVMIAMAMANNPKLLIADEPTTALDVTVQAQILELMNKLKNEFDVSIILITHDLGVVAEMADRIAVMYAGQIVEQGTADEIFYNPQHPYTEKLLESVPRLTTNNNDQLSTIEGTPPDLFHPPQGCAFFDRCDKALKICESHVPPNFQHSATHCSKCFLSHPQAKEVNND